MNKTIAEQIIDEVTQAVDNEISPKTEVERLRVENENLNRRIKWLESALEQSFHREDSMEKYKHAINDIIAACEEYGIL